MAIKLVTDSGADLLPAEAEAMGVRVVPLIVTFDGIEYRDSIDINHEQFFERLVESDVLPSTSQIPPAIFKEVFDEETANGDTVIVLTISSKLSGTYQNACIAGYDCSGVVYVVDTSGCCCSLPSSILSRECPPVRLCSAWRKNVIMCMCWQ